MKLSSSYWTCGFVLSVVFSLSLGRDNTWTEKKKSHRPKTLLSEKYQKVAEMADTAQAKNFFKDTLLKPMLKERVSGTPANKQVQKHITGFMESIGWDIETDTFIDSTPYGDKEFTNIVATKYPDAPRKLVIACHFDSKFFSNMEFIAATDSAVPCAMMLEIAKLLDPALKSETNKMRHEVSLQFIFFDGEEAFKDWTDTDSLYGARHLASQLDNARASVDREVSVSKLQTMDTMILLDLIGTKTTVFRNWFSETSNLFQRFQKIELKLAKDDLLLPKGQLKSKTKNTYFVGSSVMGGMIQDDHVPFQQKGVPILHLISYPFPKEWHKQSDNEAALDYDTINNIGRILRVFVCEYLHLRP